MRLTTKGRFAVTAMIDLGLRQHNGPVTLAEVAAWGRAGTGSDAGGYRTEFLGLVEKAQALTQ